MRIAPPLFAAALVFAAALPAAAPAGAAELRIDPARSTFAVLTRKAGVASGFAHDHLITAPKAALALSFDPADPAATRATFDVEVAKLEIDPPGPRARLEARLHQLGIGPADLPSISIADRKKVREAALSDHQLAAAAHPALRAELLGLERSAKAEGDFAWTAKLRLTLRGKSVERPLATRFESAGGQVTAEAFGEFKFSDFGIEPYSAALGAIRNDDRFYVYVALAAAP